MKSLIPSGMDFPKLTMLANRLSLTMLIILNLVNNSNYKHVVGICPGVVSLESSSPIFLKIVNGAHSSLNTMSHLTDTLDWCYGEDISLTTSAGGFTFYPGIKLSKIPFNAMMKAKCETSPSSSLFGKEQTKGR